MVQINPLILLVEDYNLKNLNQFFFSFDFRGFYFKSPIDGTSIQTIVLGHEYLGESDEYDEAYEESETHLRSYTEIIVKNLFQQTIPDNPSFGFTWHRDGNLSKLIRDNDESEDPQVYLQIDFEFTDSMAYITIWDFNQ